MANYSKIKASTQDHLDIEDITDDLVILKTGWVALVMTTTAINFDILSEAEQDATIYAYGALLNSLSFPLEILVRSKKADITSYFQGLIEAERKQTNPDLKRQIQKYQDFIQSTVQQKTVLDKKFYLIITFSPLELGLKAIAGVKPTKSKSKAQLIADAKIALLPKRDHLIKQMARLGLNARQLTTQELIELFYDIYNPAPLGTQRVILDSQSYTAPLVEPAVEVPVPAPPLTDSRPAPFPPPLTEDQLPTTNYPLPTTNLRPVPPSQPALAPTGAWPATRDQQPASPAGRPETSGALPAQQPITPRLPATEAARLSSPVAEDTGGQAGNVGQATHQTVTGQATSQAEALKKLQEATARAAGFTNPSPRPVGQQTKFTDSSNSNGDIL